MGASSVGTVPTILIEFIDISPAVRNSGNVGSVILIGGASGASPTLIIGVGVVIPPKSTLEERIIQLRSIVPNLWEAPSIIKCF